MKTCPKCGELNGDQLTNCFKCGTFIGQAAKQPPISNAPTTYQTSFGSFVFGVGIAFIIIGALGSIFASFLPLPRPRSQVSISGRSCPTPIYQGFISPSACPAPAAWLRADRQRRTPLGGEKEGCMKQSKANLGTVRHRPPLSYCAVLCR